jgi:hypothetical protein
MQNTKNLVGILYEFENGEKLTEEEATEFLAEDVRCCITCKNGCMGRDYVICANCLSGTDSYAKDNYKKYKVFEDGSAEEIIEEEENEKTSQ